jgi:photosystem II stability/assembly factor-like uncharacterized protein
MNVQSSHGRPNLLVAALALAGALALVAALSPATAVAQQRADTAKGLQAEPFRFQFMGPAGGGRIASVTGVAGDPRTWYMGSASGGVWKSSDSGHTFVPVFDSMHVQAIGALATAPSEPNTVWAGTGEAWAVRDADVMGDGIYKSTDAGKTWTNMGLRESGRIGRIIVHPTNPNIVYVCALGRATGPQQERGVYRTVDGGKTWTRVLFVDDGTGCSGIAMDAHDPNVLFAGMWQVVMHTWAMFGGGPSSGLYVTRDGGVTWSRINDPGLPHSPLGKIDVAVAPTNSNRVYALIQTADQGSVWRSDDGGRSWKVANWARTLIGRAGYYINIKVSSGNADEVLVANSSFWRSTDGAKTFRDVPWGGDTHDIWIDPKNPDSFALTDDGGAHITLNHGKSFTSVTLPNGQMYHVAVDQRVPYWIYSNRQDNSYPMRGASDSPVSLGPRRRAPIAADSTVTDSVHADSTRRDSAASRPAHRDTVAAANHSAAGPGEFGNTFGRTPWEDGLGGCESGFTMPDVADPNIVWATCYGDQVTRYDARTKVARSVSPWVHTLDAAPNTVKYRCHWTPPLAIDPFDSKTVYYGCQVIFRTSDAGQNWTVISPDLSTRDSSRIVSSGGIVADNLGQFYGEVVFAIAPSEIKRGLIWAGTNDGQLWYTRDAGAHWNNVTANIKGLPAWGTIRKIEPSHFDPATAYVAIDFHMMDNRKPYLYKTTDYGRTWTKITSNLPEDPPLGYVMSIAENPNLKGMLFAGTGNAFYYSLNDGGHWTQFNAGLPAAPVTWIVAPRRWHDVVVSTYGRGLYILRDITALEQGASPESATVTRLFAPHLAFRQSRTGHADFTFETPKAMDSVKVEVLDASGTVVRSMHMRSRAGLNRVPWDLRYDVAPQVALRTVAPDNPHIFSEPRFDGKPTRPVLHWGIEAPLSTGPIAAPGRYTVRLSTAGKDWTQPFTVIRDPVLPASDGDLAASTRAQVRVRDDMKYAAEMINHVEIMRKQIADYRQANAGKPDAQSALDRLDGQMLGVERLLLSRADLESDDKYFVERGKVYMALVWLAGEVGSGAGDVAGGADHRPTTQAMATLGSIERALTAAQASYASLMRDVVPAFNRAMAGQGIVVSPVQGKGRSH